MYYVGTLVGTIVLHERQPFATLAWATVPQLPRHDATKRQAPGASLTAEAELPLCGVDAWLGGVTPYT